MHSCCIWPNYDWLKAMTRPRSPAPKFHSPLFSRKWVLVHFELEKHLVGDNKFLLTRNSVAYWFQTRHLIFRGGGKASINWLQLGKAPITPLSTPLRRMSDVGV